MKVGIICAMQCEYDLVNSSDFGLGNEICCVLSGMGKVNAAVAAHSLILDFQPDCIINAGVAGSLRSDIREGEVVVGSQVAYHDVWCGDPNPFGRMDGCPQRFNSHPALLEAALHCRAGLHTGLIISGDQFYISEEEDCRQRGLYPDALAVDMESGAIAQVCYKYNVPFLAFRIISDSHDDGHQMENYLGFIRNMASTSYEVMQSLLKSLPTTLNNSK